MRRSIAFLILLSVVAIAHANEWETIRNCRLIENESNDGDSFHVKADGEERIFRLYFVDCPESSMQVPERVAAQAKDFGVSEKEVLDTGHEATVFTDKVLRGRFEVLTRYEDAMGSSHLKRNYAVIKTPQKEDLGMLLVKNGLARAHGMAPDAPGSYKMADYLRAQERAKRTKIGIFGGRKLADSRQDEVAEEEVVEPVKESAPPPEKESFSIPDVVGSAVAQTPTDISDQISASIGDDTLAMATMGRSRSPEKPRQESAAPTPSAPSPSSVSSTSSGGKISINNATQAELETLPQVGPKIAKAIIDGRPYEKVSDIERVPGLGEKALQMILPLVTE